MQVCMLGLWWYLIFLLRLNSEAFITMWRIIIVLTYAAKEVTLTGITINKNTKCFALLCIHVQSKQQFQANYIVKGL